MKATSLYPDEITHIDKDYRLEVELDEDDHTFDHEDHETEVNASFDGSTLSAEKSFFKGKTTKKEFSFEFGGVNKTDDGIGIDPVVYSFDTARIKEPLFGFLEQHGWARKKGFFSRLFS